MIISIGTRARVRKHMVIAVVRLMSTMTIKRTMAMVESDGRARVSALAVEIVFATVMAAVIGIRRQLFFYEHRLT